MTDGLEAVLARHRAVVNGEIMRYLTCTCRVDKVWGDLEGWEAHVAMQVRDAAWRDCAVQALREASDEIQALHPGEAKNSVIFLRERADRIARGES